MSKRGAWILIAILLLGVVLAGYLGAHGHTTSAGIVFMAAFLFFTYAKVK